MTAGDQADEDRPTGGRRLLGRRRVLQTGAAALGGAGLGWTGSAVLASTTLAPPATATPGTAPSAPAAVPAATGPTPGNRIVAFHGEHQAGVATPPQAHLALLGLDLRPEVDVEALGRLLRLLGDDASRLTTGAPALADTDPELAGVPASLTVTFGLGPRVFDELVPRHAGLVSPLPGFRTDRLERRWGQTDLAVQLCADDPLTLAHARRMLLKDAREFAVLRWLQEGFRHGAGMVEDGTTMRNVMGQVDGTVNPSPAEPTFDDLVWAGPDGPGGAAFAGGTVMVVRRIRALMDTWDEVGRVGKEAAVGRRLDTGAPLTGTAEFDEPDLDAVDDLGLPVIDPASHVARARSTGPREHMLRRAYNYVVPDPEVSDGEDAGLVFIAFASDPDVGFVPVQRRLAELDRLNEWVTTVGSAVYAVPPGVLAADPDSATTEYVGRRLLEPASDDTAGAPATTPDTSTSRS